MSRARRVKKPPTSSPAATLERDSAKQTAELAAFRRMLVVSEGCFSLSFAVCDDRTLRNDLIKRLREEFPEIAVVELAPQTPDVLRTVTDQRADTHPSAIFVLDLEASLPFAADAYPTLRVLNSSREAWEKLACPVVFWLAGYAAALLATKAPDFWRYHSHQFEFVPEKTSPSEAIRESFPGFEMVDALPFEEKRFRISELEQRLVEAGEQPSADLLPHVLDWIYELARLYQHANRYDDAETWLKRAVGFAESAYGPDDPRTTTALNNLAQLLQDTNRLVEAEPLMRRSLAIDERSFGADHPDVAICLINLAALLQDSNRLTEAEPLMRRALAIDERSLGADHPNVATDLNNLALLLQATNRLTEAESLMRRALAINERSFEADQPRVAIGLNNLALLLQATNRLSEAEPMLRRALAMDERSFGTDHPTVATRLNNLAQLLQATNRLSETEPFMRRCLMIFHEFTRRTGHEHPHLQVVLRNYAALLKQMGKTEAEIQNDLASLKRGPSEP